jgi:2-C-methyl-D-erythritol 2,4-cyclodiphosphate synthase
MWRVGIGYDSHPFVEGRPLVIGGVSIPYRRGLAGHSDADVLFHAVGDAMLGAVGAPDIGTQFPDTDPAFQGISSDLLLEEIKKIVNQRGYQVISLDAVLIAEEPKILPYVNEMKRNLSRLLEIDEGEVGIKAKTNEKMGFIGRGEGIVALSVVMVAKLGGEDR